MARPQRGRGRRRVVTRRCEKPTRVRDRIGFTLMIERATGNGRRKNVKRSEKVKQNSLLTKGVDCCDL